MQVTKQCTVDVLALIIIMARAGNTKGWEQLIWYSFLDSGANNQVTPQ